MYFVRTTFSKRGFSKPTARVGDSTEYGDSNCCPTIHKSHFRLLQLYRLCYLVTTLPGLHRESKPFLSLMCRNLRNWCTNHDALPQRLRVDRNVRVIEWAWLVVSIDATQRSGVCRYSIHIYRISVIWYVNSAVLSNDFTFSLLCFLMKAFEEILNVFKIKVLCVCIKHNYICDTIQGLWNSSN